MITTQNCVRLHSLDADHIGAGAVHGHLRAQGSLGIFDSYDAKGTWMLEVSDVARGDQGSLKAWTLTIAGSPGSAAPAAMTVGSSIGGDVTLAPGPIGVKEGTPSALLVPIRGMRQ